jgi:hypothetical protein
LAPNGNGLAALGNQSAVRLRYFYIINRCLTKPFIVMKTSQVLHKLLWANVAFAEILALAAFFLNESWAVVNELTQGYSLLFGIEMLTLAGLATYAALKKETPRKVVGAIVAMNGLLLLYLVSRLIDPAVSSMGKELIALDATAILVLMVLLIRGLKAGQTDRETVLPSPAL